MRIEAETTSAARIGPRRDRFEEWRTIPFESLPPDPRFEVRRAHPSDFPRIYDLVDEAFGRKRPRAEFDWFYRDNPYGPAHCWLVFSNETGDLVRVSVNFPWPLRRGEEDIEAFHGGDQAAARAWRRQGIGEAMKRVTFFHPWRARQVVFGGSNAQSRAIAVKVEMAYTTLGRLPAAAMLFETRPYLERLGIPRALAAPAGAVADAPLALWRRLGPAGRSAGAAPQEVKRFDSDFDAVTLRTMSFPGFWSPHGADFLNWRYFAHPTWSHVGLALLENDRPQAYCVVRFRERRATLMEFACPTQPPALAAALLAGAIDRARAAGCSHLDFFATPGWCHWPLLRRAGFLPYRSNNYLTAIGTFHEPAVWKLKNWQLVPGDWDFG